MTYSVEITDSAFGMIHAAVRYIAEDCKSPLNASRWLEQVWDAVATLEQMPQRFPLAPEDPFKPYEVRRALVGDYLILFNVDDEASKVWIIGFRHGSRTPRPQDLPGSAPGRGFDG